MRFREFFLNEKIFSLLIPITLLCSFYGQKALAQTTYTWRGGTSGSWNVPSNWTVGGVIQTIQYPGSSASNDIAVIGTSNSSVITINYAGTYTIGQLNTSGYSSYGIALNISSATSSLTISAGMNISQQNGAMVGLAFSGPGAVVISGTSTFGYQQSMTVASGTTVSFIAGSILDFTNNQGTLTNNGTINFNNSTLKIGSNSYYNSVGTTIASNTNFNIINTPGNISYSGKFVSNSCTFTMPSGAYIKSASSSSKFTAYSSTFNMSGSGGAAYIYNNGTYSDHGSTYNLSGQSAYLQNIASSIMTFRGTTINFNGSSNGQFINNAGTLTADSSSVINAATYQSYITNSGNFYAGTSGSSCVITLSGQGANVTNTGTFKLGSTSIIYPSSYQANINNTSPGIFILQSDANGTAAIGALSSTATCTGSFNVERFFQGGTVYDNTKNRWLERGYRIISSAVHNSTTVNSNYVYGLNYIVGATAGLTTTANSSTNAFITGCIGGSTSAGNPSTYLFNESYTPSNATFTSGNFLGITNITNSTTSGTITTSDGGTYSIPVGNGVFFFFRGAATNWSTRTVSPFIAPENVILTSTGNINQQSIQVKDWYSPSSSNLAYTGSGSSGNYSVRGFNMVGNPYPCTIDWCTSYSGTGITRSNVDPTVYVLNPTTYQYDTYLATSSSGGIATGSASRYIVSGQGFFVKASSAASSLVFSEAAKAPSAQLTGSNLLMGLPVSKSGNDELLRLKLIRDSLNYDDIAIVFNSSASAKYNTQEDALYMSGVNAIEGLSSFSDDGNKLAINSLPLPNLVQRIIKLNIEAAQSGTYSLRKIELTAIPELYQIWLIDKFKKDSLDIRNNSTYTFNLDINDTCTYGANRFQLVIRQNPALEVHLLNFTATKASKGAEITWTTENEQNYTNFTVERSTDGGVSYTVVGGYVSSGLGTYSILDKNPGPAIDQYRLKLVDLNGNITYSNIVTLMYANASSLAHNNINVYPNPTRNALNLTIIPAITSQAAAALATNTVYGIKIVNNTGYVIKNTTTNAVNWQTDVSNLLPGTYVIEVVNNSTNGIVGHGTFIKL